MEMLADSWYDAISTRHSRRTYNGKPIPEEVLSRLEAISQSLHTIPGARSIILRDSPEDVFTGIIGSYGGVRGAPHSIVMIGDMSSTHVQEAIGYHGEGLVLEATSKGIETCWVGGAFNADTLEKEVELSSNEKILAIIAVGHALEDKTKFERMMSGLIGSNQRKELRKLLSLGSEDPRGWMRKALEAARLAPSSVNRQPWRFNIIGNAIEVYVNGEGTKNISPRLDCGIAMMHLELGALEAGVKGRWELFNKTPYTKFVGT